MTTHSSIVASKDLETYPYRNLNVDVYSSFSHNFQEVEATKMSFSGWMDLSTVIHPDNGILFSAKRLIQTCWWVSRSLQQRCGLAVDCCRVGGTACTGTFEGGHHYLHYLHHSLALGQTTGREHSPAHQQKIGLKIYWAWPRPSYRTKFPPQSLPSGSFHKPLILLQQKADRMKTTITEN